MTAPRLVLIDWFSRYDPAGDSDSWADAADAVLALPALRDVLAAAARDAEKVATLESQNAALQRLVEDLTTGLNRELACTQRVRDVHEPDGSEPHACIECGEAWPCCTIQALDGTP